MMATTEIDFPHLSSYFSIPEFTLRSSLDAPTAELVKSLLEKVSARAREHEEVESVKLKLDVELENAVRTVDTKSRLFKGSVEKGLKEITDLRQKLQTAESSRSALESEIQTAKLSAISSTSEITNLQARISSLESSSRDTISLLESKSTAYDTLAVELRGQHQKTIDLRREVSALEQSIQSANAASSATRFHEQGLQQEIDSLKRTNEWLDKELKAKSSEYSKYRKDKSARIAELQRENEEATGSIEALRRTEVALRKRLEDVGEKADGFLSQIHSMQEEATRQEENFRIELDAANRLAELRKNSLETEKRRQEELQEEVERIKEEASEEIGRLTAEVETEHHDREAAEHTVAELEIELERLKSDIAAQQNNGFVPATPHLITNGHPSESPLPGRSPSRAFSPMSSRVKGGLNFTQMYSEYNVAKAELEAEKRRNDKLSTTIDEMIQDMESRQPEIEELQTDHDRLESDVLEMSSLVDSVGKERDQARKEARRCEGQIAGMIRESELLRQQLRDLSSQVKVLLMEVNSKNQGLDSFTAEERARLEQMARGDAEADSSQYTTDTDRFISQNLTTFKSVSDLQEQNAKLLRLTRELGNQMEGEEAQNQKNQAAQDQEELEDLRLKYERCKDEIKSLLTQSKSYVQERDMFRRILSYRGQLPAGSDLASMFGGSFEGVVPPVTPSQRSQPNDNHQSPIAKELAEYSKLVKEMQVQFDTYRQETSTDRSTLKEQVDSLSRTSGELRSEVSRKKNEVTLAHERYEMLQANYSMLKGENSELQKRSQLLSESAGKQEMRTQQVAEDLIETKALLDSVRNETANLKAEKEFWKSVEKRLYEDKERLSTERSQANILNVELQNLLNEREHSDTEVRRRLQVQVEALENELRETKRKLSDEIDEAKRAALRREFDHQQSQRRADDLMASLASVREEMVAAKTGRDHLQARVDELNIELRSAEQRAQALRPQPANQPAAGQIPNDQEDPITNEEQAANREQELIAETLELKRDLGLARGELEAAKDQVKQYKAISQSSEEELQSFNETQERYRQEMDKIIEEKDSNIRQLEQSVESVNSSILTIKSELATLQADKEQSERRLDEQRQSFGLELAQSKDLSERIQSAAHYYQEDLKAQAEIAQQAQQSYENELVKHAEAAKSLQKVRAEYHQLKLEVVELRTENESTRASLSQNEESWNSAKDRYERELSDLKSRRDDISAQNKILHQQLDNVSSQIATLQKDRNSAVEEEADVTSSTSSRANNLQEIIKYLRREKEIVEVQWELAAQEAKRLRQQLDYTQSQLDDARLKLNQQRRVEEDNERNAMNHNKLIETINELNLNRESNVTLRLEKSQAQASSAEKTKIIEELTEQFQPLRAKIRELEDAKEAQNEELRMTREARERFEQRYQDVLHKSDSIDPAEVEALREQITALRSERDGLLSSKQALQEQVDGLPERIQQAQNQASEQYEQRRQTMVEQFKARSRDLSGKAREKDAALQTAAKEKENLEIQLAGLQRELEAAKVERDQALNSRPPMQPEVVASNVQNGSEDGQVDEGRPTRPTEAEILALQEDTDAAAKKAEDEIARSAELQAEVGAARSRVSELELQVAEIQRHLDEANSKIAEALSQQQQQLVKSTSIDTVEQVAQLQQDLAQAQRDAESLRAHASVNESAANIQTEDGSKSVAGQISDRVEAIRAELNTRHDERVQQAEETFKKRADMMKTQLSKKLTEGKESVRQSLGVEYTQAVEVLKSQYEEQLQELRTRHQEEISELRRSEDSRFAQLKQTWLAEQPIPNADSNNAIKAEPPKLQNRGNLEPSETEIKRLLTENPHIKEIVGRNVSAKLNKERDTLITRVKEEQQKVLIERLAEADTKAAAVREQAVIMEGKKYGVKLNMTENRAKLSQAKIDVVQKAATDTPHRPVAEVWAIAKDAKPVPLSNQQPQQPTASISFGKPTPLTQGTFGQPTPIQRQSQSPSVPTTVQQQMAQVATTVPDQALAPQNTLSPAVIPVVSSQHSQVVSNGEPQAATVQEGSNPSVKLPQDQNTQRANASTGTGPAVLKTLQSSVHSSIPTPAGGRGGGGLNQGNNSQKVQIPTGPQISQHVVRGGLGGSMYSRGRGSGIGRGGMAPMQTSHSQSSTPSSQASPKSATGPTMNAGAKQFVPNSNKRPREDGQETGHDGNGGKRWRGGGPGEQGA